MNILEYSRYSTRETFHIKNREHTDKHTHTQEYVLSCCATKNKKKTTSKLVIRISEETSALDILCIAVIFTMKIVHLKISELVMALDMCIVCRQGHQELDKRQHHHQAGHRGEDEHHLSPLNIVLAEHLDLRLALHQHVDFLCA